MFSLKNPPRNVWKSGDFSTGSHIVFFSSSEGIRVSRPLFTKALVVLRIPVCLRLFTWFCPTDLSERMIPLCHNRSIDLALLGWSSSSTWSEERRSWEARRRKRDSQRRFLSILGGMITHKRHTLLYRESWHHKRLCKESRAHTC